MNPLAAIKRSIYLLQLENYHLLRFIKASLRSPQKVSPNITWTPKLVMVFFLSLILQVTIAYWGAMVLGRWITFFVFLYTLSFFYFILLTVSTILVTPIDYPLKQYLILKAKKKISSLRPKLKIVGITGSYGKTTTKEVIASILAQKFKVLKTPENFNTPLGVSRFVLKEVSNDTEILVVEMGAYKRGDIKKLCRLAPPDVAVLTGINESHLERFGSLQNTVRTKFEILEGLRNSGLAVLNADNALVVENSGKFFKGTPLFYTSGKHPLAFVQTEKAKFNPKSLGLDLTLTRGNTKYNFTVPFLGKYIAGAIGAGITIADKLGLTKEQVKKGVAQLRPLPHRLEIVSSKNGVVVIDDSYNGNPNGVREAINALSQFKQKRKIYVTPGLVEMGGVSPVVHKQIGEELAPVADLIILIRNSVTGNIANGLKRQGFPINDIMWFDTAQAARESLPNIVKAGDVILFQNDWPENYI